MLGVVFSLLSAACFALNASAARRAVLSGTVTQGLIVTVPMGVPLFMVLAWLTGEWSLVFALPPWSMLWFAAAGIVHFVIGRYFNYSAGAAIGVNLTSPVLQTEVLITLVMAMLLLGESLTPLRAIGIALVMLGPVMLSRRDMGHAPAGAAGAAVASAPPTFTPRYREGYTFAALAAFSYALSPIFIALGLTSAGGRGVFAGGLVSYVAATLFLAIGLLIARPPASTFTIHRSALGWFLFAGTIVFFSQAFRYAAMALAPASVVTALQRLSSLFRIYFSWAINRDHEVFDSSVIAATVVSMVGAIALSVSTETFLALYPWPDWLVRVARWQWP